MWLLLNLVAFMSLAVIPAVVISGLAGRWDLWNVWAYLGILFVSFSFQALAHYRKNPDLLKESLKPAAPGRDNPLRLAVNVMYILHWSIAGLDQRFHWSDVVPLAGVVAGLVIVAVGFGLITWSMLVNAFYSSVARIQADRGQRVISEGPYAIVRHPGYAGFILFLVASGLALNSLFSILPAVIGVAFFARVTALEDRMLRDELAGYAAYTAKVHYRLIPGVW
jgi:protein-S-isoprenylcysteine O-methyltransferase Ste14